MTNSLVSSAMSLSLLIVSQFTISCCLPAKADRQKSGAHSETSVSTLNAPYKSMRIPVYYVTDRVAEEQHATHESAPGSHLAASYYTNQRSDCLEYGSVKVSVTVPKDQRDSAHKAAEPEDWMTESASVGNRPEVENAERIESKLEFYKAVERARQASVKKQVLVYVHGYSMDFDKPMRTAGLLAYTLQMPVIAFSWPSKHNAFAYSIDECNAEWSTMDFESVLKDLSEQFGNEKMTIVGHSMGCRIVTWAIKSITDKSRDENSAPFQHIFFFSPDIDTQTFSRYSSYIEKASNDVKIFVSAKDVRLGVSRVLHGYSRLGRPGTSKKNALKELHGIETIDFTAVDKGVGHNIPYSLLTEIMNQPERPVGIQVVKKSSGAGREHFNVTKVVKNHTHQSS